MIFLWFGHMRLKTLTLSLKKWSPSNLKQPSVTSKSIILDTTVKNPSDPSRFPSKVYFKETYTHQLLDKQWFHPKHIFSGIAKSQAIRIYRICRRATDFNEACKTSFGALHTEIIQQDGCAKSNL